MCEQDKKLITYLNYKDILIIIGLWFFMAAIILISKELTLNHLLLTEIFHFLFITCGRFFYLSLTIFYLSSLYPVNFNQLGFKLSPFKEHLTSGMSKVFVLLVITLILINIRLSFVDESLIQPLFKITGPRSFMIAMPPFILIFSGSILIAFAEQFILNVIIYELFNNTLFNNLLSTILTALFYSIIILNLEPTRILMSFIAALISLILYKKKNSLIPASLFIAGYYSIMVCFVYGWEFIYF